MSGPSTETPLPVSLPCTLGGRQHERCRGVVLAGNLGPLLPCGCQDKDCVDEPRHVAAREMTGALR